jgi:TonB family protein
MSAVAAQPDAPQHGEVFLNERTLFVQPRRNERLGGALGASLGIHIAGLIAFIIVSQIPAAKQIVFQPKNPDGIIWLAEPGPGGGGGGGGNQRQEPPQKLELPGKEKLSVPVEKQPDLTKLEPPKEVPKPEPQINIPAQTMAAALETLPGTIEGVPAMTGSQGPGTGGGAGTGQGTGSGPGQGSGLGPGWGGGTGGGAYRPGSGIELPRVIREVKPSYTADAMRAKVQGIVELEAVVLPDGTVGHVEVTRSLDRTFGLDQKAIEAVRQWRFAPGTRLGQPVPVLVTIELTFTLR